MKPDTPQKSTLHFALKMVGILAIATAVTGVLFVWSGVYSVAASRGHWAVTEWLLTVVMRNSVKSHAYGTDVPPFDDDLVRLGAAHFHNGCAYCHGTPGAPTSPISRAMLPPPPDLVTQMRPWRDRELFWIVKNGIKYTGMPAWAAQSRDDEVWALVAFMRHLRQLDAKGYEALALGGVETPGQSGAQLATEEAGAAAVSACARCHGDATQGPTSQLVPILHGQPEKFLIAALEAYASGARPSGMMQPIASERRPNDRAKVARYYASLPHPQSSGATQKGSIERGRELAERGTSTTPACGSCHSAQALDIYPRLDGQQARYSANRLHLWKGGVTSATETDAIMAPIARGLSDQQIEDVTAYYASVATSLPKSSSP